MVRLFRRKSVLALVLLMVLIITAGGCGTPKESPAAANGGNEITLNIATVSNPDMLIMSDVSNQFTEKTGIKLNFIFMEENELRRAVTEDVVIGGGKYDIVTIGTYDTPFWADNKWIVSLEPYLQKMSEEEQKVYDREDLLKPIREALTDKKGEQYALPFDGESSIMLYRKDLFEAAGLEMPEEPTWDEIYTMAKQLNNPEQGVHGIILRGGSGWGQNMVIVNTMINAFGGRWYDMDWNPQFNTPEVREAMAFYKKIITETAEPNPEDKGFLECLDLMKQGKGAMWYDATSAAGPLEDKDSKVAGKMGYAKAPKNLKKDTGWLWSWALAIESSSQKKDAAFQFIQWVTSKEYINLVGEKVDWALAPPGTRVSTYENPKYQAAAPFADISLKTMQGIDYKKPTIKEVPYIGIQYLSIPEFQQLGEEVSQYVGDYLTDTITLDVFLEKCQKASEEVAIKAGYKKQ